MLVRTEANQVAAEDGTIFAEPFQNGLRINLRDRTGQIRFVAVRTDPRSIKVVDACRPKHQPVVAVITIYGQPPTTSESRDALVLSGVMAWDVVDGDYYST